MPWRSASWALSSLAPPRSIAMCASCPHACIRPLCCTHALMEGCHKGSYCKVARYTDDTGCSHMVGSALRTKPHLAHLAVLVVV